MHNNVFSIYSNSFKIWCLKKKQEIFHTKLWLIILELFCNVADSVADCEFVTEGKEHWINIIITIKNFTRISLAILNCQLQTAMISWNTYKNTCSMPSLFVSSFLYLHFFLVFCPFCVLHFESEDKYYIWVTYDRPKRMYVVFAKPSKVH